MATVDQLQTRALNFADKSAASMEQLRTIVQIYPITPDKLPAVTFTGASIAAPQSNLASIGDAPAAPAVAEYSGSVPPSLSLRQGLELFKRTWAAPVPTMPKLSTLTAPKLTSIAPPSEITDFAAPTLPTAPVVSLPAPPSFSAIAIPVIPSVEMPTFTSKLPVSSIVAPTDKFQFAEEQYKSTLLDALKMKLFSDLMNGGYGIEKNDEAGLWARARDREMRNAESKIQDTVRQTARRGFVIPPGTMNALVAEAQQAAQTAMSTLSRDIMLKRGDLYVENRQFTIKQAADMEQMLIGYYGAFMERALNASRALVELGIASYNARVAKFNSDLEAYKTEAQVYETKIRATISMLETYRLKMEGVRITSDVQRNQVEAYKAQLSGVEAMIGIYTTQLGATRTLVDIEQARIQAYKTKVEAYATRVGTQAFDLQLYEAQLRGESLKLDAYKTSISDYSARSEAFTRESEADSNYLANQLKIADVEFKMYGLDMERYNLELEKAERKTKNLLALESSGLQRYNLASDIKLRSGAFQLQQGELTMRAAVETAQLAERAAKNTSDQAVSNMRALIDGFGSRANLFAGLASSYGQLGAAAVSSAIGISTSAINSDA